MNRKYVFAIFLSIVLTVHFAVNGYIFIHGWSSLTSYPNLRTPYLLFFIFLTLSYIIARFLERKMLNWFSSMFIWIGSFWLGAMLYLFLFVLLIDVINTFNFFFHFYPDSIYSGYGKTKLYVSVIVVSIVALILFVGFINANIIRIKKLELVINKYAYNLKEINIAVASDIHLGTIISSKHLEKIVNEMNNLKADIVLLPGDVVDEDITPVIKNNLGEILRKIKSKYGVYAVTGNHEYIGGVDRAYKYLTEHGIIILRDEYVKIDDSLYIAGREDRAINQFTGKKRKPLSDILNGTDKNLPVILMDHQPSKLDEAAQCGIDLQLSGHTHHGQLLPLNYITKKVYELSWGYKKKGNTHYYVSCGVGTWGPPVRLGNRPEIVNIKLKFNC
jgi:uncharacterized protein